MLQSILGRFLGDGRSKRLEVRQFQDNLARLAETEDTVGYRKWLNELGVEEGTELHNQMLEYWSDYLRDRQQRLARA